MPKIGQKSNPVKGQEKESILNCKKKENWGTKQALQWKTEAGVLRGLSPEKSPCYPIYVLWKNKKVLKRVAEEISGLNPSVCSLTRLSNINNQDQCVYTLPSEWRPRRPLIWTSYLLSIQTMGWTTYQHLLMLKKLLV